MALIIPDGFAQVVLNWSSGNIANGMAVNTFGIGGAGPALPVTVAQVAAIVNVCVDSNLIERVTSDVTYTGCTVTTDTERVELPASQAGLQTFADPPPNVAVLVSLATAQRGRRARGRMYTYGFYSENEATEAGLLTAVARERIQAGWEGFFDELREEVPTDLVILQHTTPGPPNTPRNPTPPISPPPVVNTVTVQARLATLRRRLRP